MNTDWSKVYEIIAVDDNSSNAYNDFCKTYKVIFDKHFPEKKLSNQIEWHLDTPGWLKASWSPVLKSPHCTVNIVKIGRLQIKRST